MGAKHSHSTPLPDFNQITTAATTTSIPGLAKHAVHIAIGAAVIFVLLVFIAFFICVYLWNRLGYMATYSPHEEESHMFRPKDPISISV